MIPCVLFVSFNSTESDSFVSSFGSLYIKRDQSLCACPNSAKCWAQSSSDQLAGALSHLLKWTLSRCNLKCVPRIECLNIEMLWPIMFANHLVVLVQGYLKLVRAYAFARLESKLNGSCEVRIGHPFACIEQLARALVSAWACVYDLCLTLEYFVPSI